MSYAGLSTIPVRPVITRGPSRLCDAAALRQQYIETESAHRAVGGDLIQIAGYLRGPRTPAQVQAAMYRQTQDIQKARDLWAKMQSLLAALARCVPLNVTLTRIR